MAVEAPPPRARPAANGGTEDGLIVCGGSITQESTVGGAPSSPRMDVIEVNEVRSTTDNHIRVHNRV